MAVLPFGLEVKKFCHSIFTQYILVVPEFLEKCYDSFLVLNFLKMVYQSRFRKVTGTLRIP